MSMTNPNLSGNYTRPLSGTTQTNYGVAGDVAPMRECAPVNVCPVCGGLHTLCRPRFFAGQLLTDEDLNRLDKYIIEKNRLHNRYLHGWGVVCGLKVHCHPCPGWVTVTPGYALSPCGDDIIVERAVELDICAMINACRQAERNPCNPNDPYGAVPPRYDDADEQWELTVRYLERPTRGVMPLKNPKSHTCSCGGACGCGGNCGNCGPARQCCGQPTATTTTSTSMTSTAMTTARNGKLHCEPTVICEGYVFEVCRVSPTSDGTNPSIGDSLMGKVKRLLRQFSPVVRPVVEASSPSAAYSAALDIKDDLRQQYNYADGLNSCADGPERRWIDAFNPAPPDANTDTKTYQDDLAVTLLILLVRLSLSSLCDAILPDCPGNVCDDRVCLARLGVRRARDGSCRVVDICNFGCRRFVMTFPNLGHWLGWTRIFDFVRASIAGFCCPPVRRSQRGDQRKIAVREGEVQAMNADRSADIRTAPSRSGDGSSSAASSDYVEPAWSFTGVRSLIAEVAPAVRLFRRATARQRRGESLPPAALYAGAAERKQFNITDEEAANPFASVLMNEVVAAALNELRQSAAREISDDTPPSDKSADKSGDAATGDFGAELAELRRLVTEQAETINELKAKVG